MSVPRQQNRSGSDGARQGDRKTGPYTLISPRMYEMIADRPRGKLRLVRTRDEVLAEVGVLEWKFERLG